MYMYKCYKHYYLINSFYDTYPTLPNNIINPEREYNKIKFMDEFHYLDDMALQCNENSYYILFETYTKIILFLMMKIN